MAFQFGFANDDVDDDTVDDHHQSEMQHHDAESLKTPAPPPVQAHSLEDLLQSLPERLSYNKVRVESPLGQVIFLPRRELYDVRIQLLGEGGQDAIVDQLDKSDIRAGIYEGGFKTWECSLDLASLLLDRGPRKDIDDLMRCDHIVELGAGTALPTLVLFRHALIHAIPLTFTLADYNEEVLRLVTLPNILLTWASITDDSTTSEISADNVDDLEITPSLIEQFLADIKAKNISLNFLSGPWSLTLADLIPVSAPDMGSVILATETIYSSASTVAFVDLLAIILRRVKMAKAMIAAKRIYFGVGGSVDGFKEACREKGAVAYEIENHGVSGMQDGVGRVLMEVQMY